MRFLVGLDNRAGGRDALELTRVFASAGDSVLAVTVLYTGPLPLEYALLHEEEADEATPIFDEARAKLPDLEIETRAYGGGSPAAILIATAEREAVDAIVVGSPHRGPIGRVMIGSVATSLLNGAPADVAVAPAGYAESEQGAIREIAVGYDGSAEAKLALRHAESLALRTNGRIHLVTVVTMPIAATAMAPQSYHPQVPADPERVITEGVHSIDDKLAATGVRLDGDPAAELLKKCEDGIDLLVLGSRGYGPMARVLLGSVSRRLVQKAPCPVLVTSRP
jgi:nucleotide-binding universal stress UspA family protein